MPTTDPKQPNLPSWYPDMLVSTHLNFGRGVHFPGRLEEALNGAVVECYKDFDHEPQDEKRVGNMFRAFSSVDSPWSGRGILSSILRNTSLNASIEVFRRDAALLALSVLVVLEDRDPDLQRYKRNPRLQASLASIGCVYGADGKTGELTGDTGCRPDLLRVLEDGPAQFHPQVLTFAHDVIDGVKGASEGNDGGFLAEHRSLIRLCRIRRENEFVLASEDIVHSHAVILADALRKRACGRFPRDARAWPGTRFSYVKGFLLDGSFGVIVLRGDCLGGEIPRVAGPFEPLPDVSLQAVDLPTAHAVLRKLLGLDLLDALFVVPLRRAAKLPREVMETWSEDDLALVQLQCELNIHIQAHALRIPQVPAPPATWTGRLIDHGRAAGIIGYPSAESPSRKALWNRVVAAKEGDPYFVLNRAKKKGKLPEDAVMYVARLLDSAQEGERRGKEARQRLIRVQKSERPAVDQAQLIEEAMRKFNLDG